MTRTPFFVPALAMSACLQPIASIQAEQSAPRLVLTASDDHKAFLVRVCYDGESANVMNIELDVGRVELPNSLEVSMTDVGEVQLVPDRNEELTKDFVDPERVFAWMCLDGFRVDFTLTGLYSESLETGWTISATAIQNDGGDELRDDEVVIEIVELDG
ncbi:MAG: hypothetical protein ACPG4T_05570 [Nannocystaceae bacterium]